MARREEKITKRELNEKEMTKDCAYVILSGTLSVFKDSY